MTISNKCKVAKLCLFLSAGANFRTARIQNVCGAEGDRRIDFQCLTFPLCNSKIDRRWKTERKLAHFVCLPSKACQQTSIFFFCIQRNRSSVITIEVEEKVPVVAEVLGNVKSQNLHVATYTAVPYPRQRKRELNYVNEKTSRSTMNEDETDCLCLLSVSKCAVVCSKYVRLARRSNWFCYLKLYCSPTSHGQPLLCGYVAMFYLQIMCFMRWEILFFPRKKNKNEEFEFMFN